jgi:hypothetical protein
MFNGRHSIYQMITWKALAIPRTPFDIAPPSLVILMGVIMSGSANWFGITNRVCSNSSICMASQLSWMTIEMHFACFAVITTSQVPVIVSSVTPANSVLSFTHDSFWHLWVPQKWTRILKNMIMGPVCGFPDGSRGCCEDVYDLVRDCHGARLWSWEYSIMMSRLIRGQLFVWIERK